MPIDDARFAFVGCFTTAERRARGCGIVTCRIDAGRWTPIAETGGLDNPSFLSLDRARLRLYVAHGDRDHVSVLSVDPESGALRWLGQAAAGGDNCVHLAPDPARRFLIVANHASGSLGLLPLTDDGRALDFVHRLGLPGAPGPHPLEQTGSHPHQIVFDAAGAFLLAPDKGLDRVFTLRLDPIDRRLEIVRHAAFPPGSGPRHLAFHPGGRWAFVACELDSTIVVCAWDRRTGTLTPGQRLPCVPVGFSGANTVAAIVVEPDGRSVHVSNRGHDSIAHFTLDAVPGRLAAAGWTESGGAVPRFMCLARGGGLIVANEQSDSLFQFDQPCGPGRLLLRTPSPSAIEFL